MPTLLSQANRSNRIESSSVVVPGTAASLYQFVSDLGAADMADANNWVLMEIDVQDASQPGGWHLKRGGGCIFQCGPTRNRDGTINPSGANRGFDCIVDEKDSQGNILWTLRGKTIRGVLELRTGTINDNLPVDPQFQSLPFTTMRIGVTYNVVP